MDIEKARTKMRRWKLLLLVLAGIGVLVTVCVVFFPDQVEGYFGPCAPQRSFEPEDLLIDQDVIPAIWPDVWGPDTELYDHICESAHASIRFGVDERESPLQVIQDIERRGKIIWARAVFENSSMFSTFPKQPNEWTYQSPIADQSYFGCANYGPSTTKLLSCQWVGRYDEFIAILWVRMTPNEVNIEDIERMVRAIDARMALHLGR